MIWDQDDGGSNPSAPINHYTGERSSVGKSVGVPCRRRGFESRRSLSRAVSLTEKPCATNADECGFKSCTAFSFSPLTDKARVAKRQRRRSAKPLIIGSSPVACFQNGSADADGLTSLRGASRLRPSSPPSHTHSRLFLAPLRLCAKLLCDNSIKLRAKTQRREEEF